MHIAIMLAPLLTQTLKCIDYELLAWLKKTTHSEKAEGSNPASSFPLGYKSSDDNFHMTKYNWWKMRIHPSPP